MLHGNTTWYITIHPGRRGEGNAVLAPRLPDLQSPSPPNQTLQRAQGNIFYPEIDTHKNMDKHERTIFSLKTKTSIDCVRIRMAKGGQVAVDSGHPPAVYKTKKEQI